MSTSDSDFGTRLKAALKAAGLTQKEAARLLNISESAMCNYARGRIPEAKILYRIARLCNCSMEWLIAGEGPGPPQPAKRAREPDAARVIAAVAALEKNELESYLKGEMPPERFMHRVAELSGLPPPAVESLIQSMGRVNRSENREEAAASDLPEETKKLLCYWSELTEEQRKDLLARATYYYGQKVAPGKSGPSAQPKEPKEKDPESPRLQQANGFF